MNEGGAEPERTGSLDDIQTELLERFARTVKYREPPEFARWEQVAAAARLVAQELGIPEERADLIGRAALLHDIGKASIPASIWAKPDRLTPEEFERVKAHTEEGAEILSEGHSQLLALAEEIAATHHEHWDGNGYLGLSGQDIPIEGRIMAVADTYDALTHERPYRHARSTQDAISELRREAGHQFDPEVVEAFLRVRETPEFAALYEQV